MTAARSRRTRTAAGAALLVLLAGPVLTACSGFDPAREGATYTDGKATITTRDADSRDEPVEFSGTTLEGDALDVADYRGKVVVINIWGSWCGPCRAEMPHLVKAAAELGDDVAFVGINVRDTEGKAKAFERRYEVTWPSIADEGGRTLLALRGTLPPNYTPSTLVLDPEGRVAALISGPAPSAITIQDLVEDAA